LSPTSPFIRLSLEDLGGDGERHSHSCAQREHRRSDGQTGLRHVWVSGTKRRHGTVSQRGFRRSCPLVFHSGKSHLYIEAIEATTFRIHTN
jgi:hypothetical protein